MSFNIFEFGIKCSQCYKFVNGHTEKEMEICSLNNFLKHNRISYKQSIIIKSLKELHGKNQYAIAKLLKIRMGTISKQITKLEKIEIVKTEKIINERGITRIVELTEKGKVLGILLSANKITKRERSIRSRLEVNKND